MAGISSKAAGGLENKRKFNGGTELNNDLDISTYETPLRGYNAQIGRFSGIDILADKYSSITPYQFAANNPIIFNDPTGAEYSYKDKNGDKWHHADLFSGTAAAGQAYQKGNGFDGFGDRSRVTGMENFSQYLNDLYKNSSNGITTYTNETSGKSSLYNYTNLKGANFGAPEYHGLQSHTEGEMYYYTGIASMPRYEQGEAHSGLDYLGVAVGAVGTYAGYVGEAFHNELYWVQRNGIARLTSTAKSNYTFERSYNLIGGELSTAKAIGKYASIAGVAISAYQFAENRSYANGFDLAMSFTAFIPGVGWAISGTYFLANTMDQAITGQTIGQQIFGKGHF